MGFASEHTELRRLLLLAATVAGIELVLVPGAIFKLLAVSANWSVLQQLLVLFLPRFALMLVLVLMFGPFRKGLWFSGFLAAYAALLVVRFFRAEAFVEWASVIAASRATLPYAAGIAGAVVAFWIRRKGRTAGISASGLDGLSSKG